MNTLKHEVHPVKKINPYRKENTTLHHHKAQVVNAVKYLENVLRIIQSSEINPVNKIQIGSYRNHCICLG
jgi:hypothetical protein